MFTKGLQEYSNIHVFANLASLGEANLKYETTRQWEIQIYGEATKVSVTYLPCKKILGEYVVSPVDLCHALNNYSPDLVWTNSPSVTSDIAQTYAILNGIPWVTTYHADSGPAWYGLVYSHLEAVLLRFATRIMVHSERYRKKLLRRGIRKEKIYIAPVAPYLAGFQPTSTVPDPQVCNPERKDAFLFVGVLDDAHKYKRPELLIQALANLRQLGTVVQLRIVGDGNCKDSLQRSTERLGVSQQVAFLGTLSPADLAREFQTAQGLVICSDSESEGYGIVAVEAMYYGLPVIVPKIVPVSEMVQRLGAGIVYDSSDANGLSSALLRLCGNETLRAACQRAARSSANELDWRKSIMPQQINPILSILCQKRS